MAFGFGKKDKDQAPAPQGQQISPEALALLEQMAAAGGGAAAQTPAQSGAMPQQPMQPQEMQPQGMQPQGMQPQGMQPQGMQPQGMQPQGMQPQGMQPQGMQPQGMPLQPDPTMAPQLAPQMQGIAPIGASADAAIQPTGMPQMAGGIAGAEFRAPEMPGMPTMPDDADGKKRKKGKKSKKPGKLKLTREEKKAAAKQAKDEKDRNKRRKKLSKSRFSRARYLREANGNAIAGLALWIFMIIVFIAGPFVVNTQFLLPQTRANNDVVNQISQLQDTISRSQPQIELAVRNKSDRENELKTKTGSFASAASVKTAFDGFIADLKANNIEFDETSPPLVLPQNIGVTGLAGQTLNLVVRADFITYLRIRNKFVSSMRSIRISDEVIQAEPGDPVMSIRVTITIPSKIS